MNYRSIVVAGGVASLVVCGSVYAACGACGKHAAGATVKAAGDCKGGACQAKVQSAVQVQVEAAAPETAHVTTATLAVLIKANAVPVILDARSGKYDDGRRLPGAKSLTDKATAEAAAGLIAAKDTLVVTYCSNLKCPASAKLAARLRELGYTNVLEYSEGIDGWTAAGNAVEKPE